MEDKDTTPAYVVEETRYDYDGCPRHDILFANADRLYAEEAFYELVASSQTYRTQNILYLSQWNGGIKKVLLEYKAGKKR